MEEYLTKLNLERDYEEMMKLLLNKEEVENVKTFFTELNVKVLLSSFLIKNFFEYYLLNEHDDLVKHSKKCVDLF